MDKVIEKNSPEDVINRLEIWEATHLTKIEAKRASMDFGMVSEAVRKMGERIQRRLNSLMQNKCFVCGKELTVNRIFNTRAVFEKLAGNHVNRYACSAKCDDKLEEIARKAMTELQAE